MRRPREQQPLIIERPDLAHPLRRATALLFTLLAWAGWVALWLPVIGSLTAHFGLVLPWINYPGLLSLNSLSQLLDVFPLAIGSVLLVLAINGLISRILRRFNKPQAHGFVGMDRLAAGMALDPDKLTTWQAARILHVEHGPKGRVINARTVSKATPERQSTSHS